MPGMIIRGGRIIDPSQGIDRIGDLTIREGCITEDTRGDEPIFDARGFIVSPGLVDLHCSLREPGNEEDETIESGTRAALAGGFTSVTCMPDTACVVDNRSEAEFILLQAERARSCRVYPLGAITKGCGGQELAEIGQLVGAGVMGFSDGRTPVGNPEIMRRALQYTKMFSRPIFTRAKVKELQGNGVMHDGFVSTRLGLPGIPSGAEQIMVGRDLALLEMTGGRLHIQTLSTIQAINLVREAKSRNLPVTCEMAAHQLAFLDEAMESYSPLLKVDPPFRTSADHQACIQGLKDGTIDVICSDHQPSSPEKIDREISYVPFGITTLETVLPVCIRTLIEPGHLDWNQLIEKLSWNPARILGIPSGTLKQGSRADVTLIDPDNEWTIDVNRFASQSKNSPFHEMRVRGKSAATIVGGEVRYLSAHARTRWG